MDKNQMLENFEYLLNGGILESNTGFEYRVNSSRLEYKDKSSSVWKNSPNDLFTLFRLQPIKKISKEEKLKKLFLNYGENLKIKEISNSYISIFHQEEEVINTIDFENNTYYISIKSPDSFWTMNFPRGFLDKLLDFYMEEGGFLDG